MLGLFDLDLAKFEKMADDAIEFKKEVDARLGNIENALALINKKLDKIVESEK